MANNVSITAGAGTVVATDDAGGAHYQIMKLAGGAEDSTDRIGGDAANGLDVDVTRLPADPLGANSDAAATPGGTGSISAKFRTLTGAIKAEDAAHVSGDTGFPVFTVRKDVPTALAGTDGDYALLETASNGSLHTSLGTLIAGEDETNNVLRTEERSSYLGNQTADVLVKSGAGRLFGIFVSASTTLVLKVWDNTAASGTVIINDVTVAAATLYRFPGIQFSTGLFVDVVSGTGNFAVFYK